MQPNSDSDKKKPKNNQTGRGAKPEAEQRGASGGTLTPNLVSAHYSWIIDMFYLN